MAIKNVEFHEEAALEFLAAVEWYLARSELVASRFAQQITHAVQLIAEAPQRWPNYSHGTRKFVLRRFPFLVVYRELATVIQILAVAHAHRRPGYWKTRR
jgi:plasmid stabilization system protein ParE